MEEQIKELTSKIELINKGLEELKAELREDLVQQAREVSDLSDDVLKKCTRCDLKLIIKKHTEKAEEEASTPPERKDAKPLNPFGKPEGFI